MDNKQYSELLDYLLKGQLPKEVNEIYLKSKRVYNKV